MRKIIGTAAAPTAVGPYSQAVVANGMLYCSGQLGLNPADGKMVDGGVEPQTRRLMANLAAVLKSAGSNLERVVSTTVFLADMNDFAEFNAVYAEYFPVDPPARVTVQAAALPLGALVEVACVALVDAGN